MDESIDLITSLEHEEVSSSTTVELNKKRKLQFALGLPLPKHKFRDRCNGTSSGKEIADDSKKSLGNEVTDHELELPSIESENDSNSFNEESYMEMTLEHGDDPKIKTSSAGINKGNKEEFLYSLDIRGGKERKRPSLDGILNFEDMEDDDQNFLYANIISQYEKDGIQLSEAAADMLLYTNDVLPNMFAISSGSGLAVSEDAQLGARKPTIDQEFEQYFSMLML